jgi:hypothetical protein
MVAVMSAIEAATPDGFRPGMDNRPDERGLLQRGRDRVTRTVMDRLIQAQLDATGVRQDGTDYVVDEAKYAVDYDEEQATTARSLVAGQDRDLIGTMLTVIIAAVIGFAGLVVMSRTESTTSFESNSAFDNSSQSLSGGVETFFSMVEVVFIAIVLSLIIGALLFLRRR